MYRNGGSEPIMPLHVTGIKTQQVPTSGGLTLMSTSRRTPTHVTHADFPLCKVENQPLPKRCPSRAEVTRPWHGAFRTCTPQGPTEATRLLLSSDRAVLFGLRRASPASCSGTPSNMCILGVVQICLAFRQLNTSPAVPAQDLFSTCAEDSFPSSPSPSQGTAHSEHPSSGLPRSPRRHTS